MRNRSNESGARPSSWINLRFVLGTVVFWALFLVVTLMSTLGDSSMSLEEVVSQWGTFAVQVSAFSLATLLYFEGTRRLGPRIRSRWVYAATLTGAVVISSAIHVSSTLLQVSLGQGEVDGSWFWSMWITCAMQHGAVLGAAVAANSFLLGERRRRELSEVRLQALRNQIRPHFLFNTLQSISTMTRRDADRAVKMIALLGDLLRHSLSDRPRSFVTLAEELEMVEPYFELQRLRFGDRLTIRIDVPVELLGLQVPDLLLQPLIENAIEHGIERDPGAGEIVIRASRRSGDLVLEVEDDAQSSDSLPNTDGIGLGATRSRLEALFGSRASLDLRRRPSRGTTAVACLPLAEESRVA